MVCNKHILMALGLGAEVHSGIELCARDVRHLFFQLLYRTYVLVRVIQRHGGQTDYNGKEPSMSHRASLKTIMRIADISS